MASILDVLDRPHRGTRRARHRMSPLERVARNIVIDEVGCWLWTGRLSNERYAQFTVTQTGYPTVTLSGHKVSYELHNGRVPDGMVLDHLCRTRHCVNPDHLEVVRQRVNTLRSPIALGSINAAKTHCPQGHPYSPENTYVYRLKTRSTTTRTCKTCRAEQRRRWLARKNGAAA